MCSSAPEWPTIVNDPFHQTITDSLRDGYCVNEIDGSCNGLQVIDKIERETGFEPATSSLGNRL